MTIKELKDILAVIPQEFEHIQVLVEHPMSLTGDYRQQEFATFGGIEEGFLIIRPLSNIEALRAIEDGVGQEQTEITE